MSIRHPFMSFTPSPSSSPSPLDAVLIRFVSARRTSAREQKQPVHHNAGEEAADVRPPGYASDIVRPEAAQRAAEHLAQKPETDIDEGRKFEEKRQEENRKYHDDAGARIKNEVCAEHASYRTRRPDCWHRRVDVGEPVREARGDTSEQVEQEETHSAHAVFDGFAEEPESPHVGDEVQPAPMQKHAGQERPVVVDRESDCARPFGMAVASRDHAEQVEKLLQLFRGELELAEKNSG